MLIFLSELFVLLSQSILGEIVRVFGSDLLERFLETDSFVGKGEKLLVWVHGVGNAAIGSS